MTTEEDRDWRQYALAAVVVALMVVSISGQVQAIEPKLGKGFALVFAVAHDAGAILALEAGLKAKRGSTARRWAWTAILMAAGTGGILNVWHVAVQPMQIAGESLPVWLLTAFGLLLGLEPIALILVLSHLVGLVLTERKDHQTTRTDDHQDPRHDDHQTTHVVVGGPPVRDHQNRAASPVPATTRTAELVTSATTRTARDRSVARQVSAAARPTSPTTTARVGLPGPRPDWMTEALVWAVVRSMRKAGVPDGKRYGPGRCRTEHGLSTEHQAKAVLAYIEKHGLLRESA